MTVDEIKSAYSMRDVLLKYGFSVGRDGFCSCMLHDGDHTASFKVYPDSFHCYGCGKGGDIINWVQEYLHCDFKTAFYELGGSYKKPQSLKELRAIEAQKREFAKLKAEKEKKRQKAAEAKALIAAEITIIREHLERYEVFSKPWSLLMDDFNMLTDALMQITERGCLEDGVYSERLRRYIE